MSVHQMFIPLIQIGDVLNLIAPHNVLASLMTGGQYHAPIYSEESAAEVYNPSQLSNNIPGVTFGYLKVVPYTKEGYAEPTNPVSFWVYNKTNQPKPLHIEVNQLLCRRVSTGGNLPCEYEPGTYPLVYMTDIVLGPGGAREIKFLMPTPPVSPMVGEVQRVRVDVNITDEKGNKAKLAATTVPK